VIWSGAVRALSLVVAGRVLALFEKAVFEAIARGHSSDRIEAAPTLEFRRGVKLRDMCGVRAAHFNRAAKLASSSSCGCPAAECAAGLGASECSAMRFGCLRSASGMWVFCF